MTAERLQALKTRLGIDTITTRYRRGVWCTTCSNASTITRCSATSLDDSVKTAIGQFAVRKGFN